MPPDDFLFHDLAALAARVEDEAERCLEIGSDPGVDAQTACAAGVAHAKLDTLEQAMFDATNTIHHQARELELDASPAKNWGEQKEGHRVRHKAARLVSDGAVCG